MQNPSYLIRSRHAIFYFRYPVAKCSDGKVSVSLKMPKVGEHSARLMYTLTYIDKKCARKHTTSIIEYI